MDGAGGAAGGSFESIQTLTATGGETSLIFTSIPSTFKHLQIRGIVKDTSTGSFSRAGLTLRFNSDSGNNYALHSLTGDGTAASAGGYAPDSACYIQSAAIGSLGDSLTYATSIIDIIDYASTTKNKTLRAFSGVDKNASGGGVSLSSSLWVDTSAITNIEMRKSITSFAAGTVFSLYGIKG
jgi:hypothetical protein